MSLFSTVSCLALKLIRSSSQFAVLSHFSHADSGIPRNFCDKMVTSFLPSFLSLILRQRRVNEMGTQQLLLDVYNLKTLMLKVPSLGGLMLVITYQTGAMTLNLIQFNPIQSNPLLSYGRLPVAYPLILIFSYVFRFGPPSEHPSSGQLHEIRHQAHVEDRDGLVIVTQL